MISLVVPTYNERSNVERLARRAGAALAQCGEEYELIIVDDSSPDGTPDEVRRLTAELPWLRLLVREQERDLSTAVIAGWQIARGDVLGCMDADLQHPPELVPKLLAELRQSGAEIVVGSRNIAGGGVSDWSLARRFISWTATLMATTILPGTLGKVTDPMSGFFLVRRSVLARAALNPIGYKILLEVLAKGDYTRAAEVPFVFEEREKGGSKMNAAIVFKYLAHLLRISLDSGEAARMLKYGMVGLSGTVVNGLALWWFLRQWHWPLLVAALVAAALAMVNNFIWNDRFTFAETRRARPGWTQTLGRFVAFAAFSGTGVAINVGIIWVLRSVLGAPLTLSAVTGIGIAAVWNFLLNSNVTWRAWWDRKLLSRTARAPEPLEARDLTWVPCVQCGSHDAHILYAGEAPRAAGIRRRPGQFTNIVQCSQCGLLFVNPRIAGAPPDSRHRSGTPATLLDKLEGRVARGTILDFGCGMGEFLDAARARGWQTAGVEPECVAARHAQEKGHAVVCAPFEKTGLEDRAYRAVTLGTLLDGVEDPARVLREAYRLLEPGGVLAVRAFDSSTMFARLAGRRWPGFSSGSLYFFTPGTLTRLLAAAGFEVVSIEKRQASPMTLRELLEMLAALLGPLEPLVRVLGRPFAGVSVRVDLGDTMSVLAAKSSRP